MRAILLRRQGIADELVPSEVPEPVPTDDSCIVRVMACAVCHRDVIDRRGDFALARLPTILGHEFSGVIETMGDRARKESDLREGDRVVNLHRAYCGACSACKNNHPLRCERAWQRFGHTIDGAYAEKVAAPYGALVRLSDKIPFDQGSCLMCTAGVVLFALRRRGRWRQGESVLITGAGGGLGTTAIQVLASLGAEIIAVTSSESKRDDLVRFGAHHVIVAKDRPFFEDVRAIVPRGVDVALEITGPPTFASSQRSLAPGGRLIVLGNIERSKVELQLGAVVIQGLEIIGAASCVKEDVLDAMALVESGKLSPAIAHRWPLFRAADAHREIESRRVLGRIVLMPNMDDAIGS